MAKPRPDDTFNIGTGPNDLTRDVMIMMCQIFDMFDNRSMN